MYNIHTILIFLSFNEIKWSNIIAVTKHSYALSMLNEKMSFLGLFPLSAFILIKYNSIIYHYSSLYFSTS